MYQKILLNRNLPFRNRIAKLLLYFRKRRAARIGWNNAYKKMFKIHPACNKPVLKELETEHKKYWKDFSVSINMSTFRVCNNISGISDPKFIPEEIFLSDIEPTLNSTSSVEFLQYKSFYTKWFSNNCFPSCYFHNVDGEFLDQKLNSISFSDVEKIIKELKYPVVFKPNRDSYGGAGVFFPKSHEELLNHLNGRRNFVVQEKINQHPFFNKFNPVGLNTIRVCLYRSVSDNKIHVLNCTLRMGVGGSLDNVTSGGISCFIDESGRLTGVSIDNYGKKFQYHPDSGMSFLNRIPFFSELIESSINVSSQIFYTRLMSLDFSLDINGTWRPIEINLFYNTITFAQYAGVPFFGLFTDEVLEYCKKNHWALR